jgi:hypothetical protein
MKGHCLQLLGRQLLALLLWSSLGAWSIRAAAAEPVVIELFTSQGCSSCPPADALLGELARKPNVVALAYHVDYWDDLGWKDRFSIPEATQRQRGYVRKLSKSGAFTPQAVVSGDTSLIGSNRAAVTKAVAADRDALAVQLSRERGALVIDLPERWREPMDVHVVSYLAEATTKIGRGENANRTVRYVNIVRSFKRLGAWNGKPQRMTLPLASLPEDATAVAVLLQRPGQGAIAGAATLALRESR